MGLTKEQLEQLNNNSFPNNNSGYITPDILRTYNDAVIVNTVNQTAYSADSASFNYRLQNFNPDNLVTTATFNAYTSSNNAALSSLSQSYIAFTASYYVDSASFDNRINTFNPTNLVNTASFNAYTQSVNTQLANIEAQTGSYLTTGSTTSNQYVSGNLSFTEVNTFVTQSTANNVNTHNGGTLEFLAGNISNTYPSLYDIVGFGSTVWSLLRVSGAGLSTPLISNMFISGANNVYVTVAGGNSVSGSSYSLVGPIPQNVDFKVNNLIVSGNIVTNGTVNTNTIGANSGNTVTISSQTASVNRLEATNISSSIVSASFVTAVSASAVSASFGFLSVDSASITYLKVIYETSSVVFSSGSNILGDNANDDVQTLIGRTKVTGSLEVTGSLKTAADISSSTLNGIGNVTLYSQSVAGTDFTQSANIASLTSKTGSYATTGSNQFKGTQTITGSLIVTANDGSSSVIQFPFAVGGVAQSPAQITQNSNGDVNFEANSGQFGFQVSGFVPGGSNGVAYNFNGNAASVNFQNGNDATGSPIGAQYPQMTFYTNDNLYLGGQFGGYQVQDLKNGYDNPITMVGLAGNSYTPEFSNEYVGWIGGGGNNTNGSNTAIIMRTGSADMLVYKPTKFNFPISASSTTYFSELTGSLGAYSASVNSRITNNSSSLATLSSSFTQTSSSLNVVSSSLNVVSSSAFALSGAFAITSASLNVVSSSLNIVSSSFVVTSGSLNAVSASAYSISGSYNSLSQSAVSNVTDTYTSVALPKYIVTLTTAEYNAIVTKDPNTIYFTI